MSLKFTGLNEYVSEGICTFCGACLAACPRQVLVPLDESFFLAAQKISRKYYCMTCGICYSQCPLTDFSLDEAEKRALGRSREKDEALGVHRGYYVASSANKEILAAGQDGGIVTSILAYLLKSQKIDGAIVSGTKDDLVWKPWPLVATTCEELVESAGSKYTPSPQLYSLREASGSNEKFKLAMTGLPCNVWGLRKMQFFRHRMFESKTVDNVKFMIGLFCMESYKYNGLVDYLRGQRIDPATVSRFDIKKGKFICYVNKNEALNLPVSTLKAIVRNSCHHCIDYAAELADISVGGAGCETGTSIVIIRSEKGEEAFGGALEEGFITAKKIEASSLEFLENLKIASFKKRRAKVPYIPTCKRGTVIA